MRVVAITREQETAALTTPGGSQFHIMVGDIEFQVAYNKIDNDVNGQVWAYFDNGNARLDVAPAAGKRRQDEAYVSYKGVGAEFADTAEITDPGLRGLAEAMLTARYQADQLVAARVAQRKAEEEARRQVALDYIDKKL